MAIRTFIVDSGGTARQVRRLPIVDSGGTTRLTKRAFIIDSGGTTRQFFASGINATMVAGATTASSDEWIGYDDGTSSTVPTPIGSMSSVITGFGTVASLVDHYVDFGVGFGYFSTELFTKGLSSDPGQSAFTTLTISPGSSLASASASYNYSAGVASWAWISAGPFFTNTSAYTITTV